MAKRMEDLYTELHGPIYRFLAALTGDPDAAEELTQETFLQAILSLPRFRRESSLTTWLYAIARNQYRKRLARESRRPLADPPAAPYASPDEVAEAREERRRLFRALAALPEAYREALVLREYEGLSYAQIGQVLGKSETWARVTCFRARRMLQEAYQPSRAGTGPPPTTWSWTSASRNGSRARRRCSRSRRPGTADGRSTCCIL